MTSLRNRMRDDLRLRNYARATEKMYMYHADAFVRHFGKSPTRIDSHEIRGYLLGMAQEGRYSVGWWRQTVATLRFLYGTTLGQSDMVPSIPYPRKEYPLPVVLTVGEVERLLNSVTNPKYRLALMTIYSAGLRTSEGLNLAWNDLDTSRMVIHVRQGKGRRDRFVPLSPVLLEALRQHAWEHGKAVWLFPTRNGRSPLHSRVIQTATRHASERAGITKHVTPRTLRHCFATHLLESGTDIRVIQKLLGHAGLRTTEIYTHVSTECIGSVRSPLDQLDVSGPPSQLLLDGF